MSRLIGKACWCGHDTVAHEPTGCIACAHGRLDPRHRFRPVSELPAIPANLIREEGPPRTEGHAHGWRYKRAGQRGKVIR